VIDVGQVLDKYELLERVGQGGMAVVYRGLDRSLRRTVAVKVLHRHLADHQEARDRFEREAHAVAKLRHENILEIFDYSGGTSDESYIVTEFIDGATLKEFVGDHPPQHAEIGAMIVLQVCRALAHAHGQGILHRDVKPENVMIRSDGVVKLTDFGISQMLDVHRLTVTGQLLGSPAYMSPEHVEGQPLDFRTDVFAAGIVLYQLTVGKLPFEGKNPHEILKRIAECRFPDPRQANPRIGNELGKIILRAMARDPDDRYPDVTAMVTALERYLEGSGLDTPAKELARYFAAPASYEMALHQRLVDHLTRRGKELYTDKHRGAALELFDRVLTLDPDNAGVLRLIDGMARRRRWVRVAVAAGAVAVMAVGTWYARRLFEPAPASQIVPAQVGADEHTQGGTGVALAQILPDARPAEPAPPDAAPPVVHHVGGHHAQALPDAGVVGGTVVVVVSPDESAVQIGTGPWKTYPGGRIEVPVAGAPVKLTARNACCQADGITVGPADVGKAAPRLLKLGYLPGTIVPRCKVAGVRVQIDGRSVDLDKPAPITFGDSIRSEKQVLVEFIGADRVDPQKVTVRAHDTREVTCKL